MKILHLPFGYFPDIRGGTEVYVAALCRELSASDHKVAVAAPGNRLEQYQHDGIPVYRYPVNGSLPGSVRNGAGDPDAAAHVGRILDKLRPEIVHLHALTSGVSLLVLREASWRGIQTMLTYHTPTVSCARGTLLYRGQEICDGLLDERRCTGCSLEDLGLHRILAKGFANMPKWLGRLAALADVKARWLTALRRREMVGLRHETVCSVFAEIDHVIVLCDWTEKLLQRNRFGLGKTSVIRHALPHRINDKLVDQITVPKKFTENNPLRLVYLGRIASEKGVDIIVKAVELLPKSIPVTLDIYGMKQDEGGYVQEVVNSAESSSRIFFHSPVPSDEVISLLRGFHALLVPSQWLETGPFVVLEALFAKTPVLGSKLGGICDWITDTSNGFLVDNYSMAHAWSNYIETLVSKPDIIEAMRSIITEYRGFEQVACEHLKIYTETKKEDFCLKKGINDER